MSAAGTKRRRGYVLLPTALGISLVAAIAFLLNRESALHAGMTSGEVEAELARFVAEAGFHHARWLLMANGCGGGSPNLPATPFGDHSYSASVGPVPGGVAITATGTLASGVARSVTRSGIPVTALPQTEILQPANGKDTYLDDGQQATNHSLESDVKISNKTNSNDHALLWFDVTGIPANADIIFASLELNLEGIGSDNAGTVFVHRLTRDWIEAEATWLEYESGGSWTVPGGDHDAQAASSAPVDWAQPGAVAFDVRDLVRDWVSGVQPNFGMLLEGSEGLNHVSFSSSDHLDPTVHPRLTIQYRCPCGVPCVEAVGFYRDEFTQNTCDPAVDWTGSDGSLDWSGETWVELGEANGPCAGEVRLVSNLGSYAMRFANDQRGLERRVDLSSFGTARLVFHAMRIDLDDASDALVVEISDDGGGSWDEVGRVTGPGTDADYQTQEFDISAWAAADTRIRLVTSGLGGSGAGTDFVFVDDVQIDREFVGGGANPTLVLNPEADTRLSENDPDANYGGEDGLRLGKDAGQKQHRSLLRFDVSALPATATVETATLRLYHVADWGSKDVAVEAYRVTAAWDEGLATWNSTGGGGTYDPGLLDSTAMASGPDVWSSWSLPPALIHGWRDGVTPNHGVLLLPNAGASKNNWIVPASREHATVEWRPELVLEYTP